MTEQENFEHAVQIAWTNKYASLQQLIYNFQGMAFLLSGSELWEDANFLMCLAITLRSMDDDNEQH